MAPSAASPVSLLLPFCQFLLHRVQTENLELLQRAISEFLGVPSSFETVETMVRLAFPLVAILPVDHPDADARAHADAILLRMQQLTSRNVDDTFLELHAGLQLRVELKNWDWLERIFAEFCVGHDTCLRQFVALQRQAISIVPLRAMGAMRASLFAPSVSSSRSSAIVPTTSSNVPIKRMQTSPRSVAESDGGVPQQSSVVKAQRSRKKVQISKAHRQAIFAALLEVEKQRPWEAVFDVSKIQYPFDETAHPELANELKTFWQRHARAVWERWFWYSYGSPTEYATRQEDRKCRQDVATRSFESHVMVRAYEAFGPEFFVDLDLRHDHHYWWWYRRPVMDIVRMGAERCVQYLNTMAFARFPDPPVGFERRGHVHDSGKVSFWAVIAKYQEYREVTEKRKAARLAQRA